MSETPAQAFCRIRLERGDKWIYLGALCGVSGPSVQGSVACYGRVPKRWVPYLPEEYRIGVVDAMIAEHLDSIAELERMKPRILGSGASGSDRDSGEF